MNKHTKKRTIYILRLLTGIIITLAIVIFTCFAFTSKHSKAKSMSENNSSKVVSLDKISTSKSKQSFDVCIDAGHGGKDFGCNIDNHLEKDDNLLLSTEIYNYLSKKGISVALTRSSDTYLSLSRRKELANSADCRLFISIHRNYYENGADINGAEAWIHSSSPSASYNLANQILSSICDQANFNFNTFSNRGVKSGTMDNPSDNYAVNTLSMTSMILEMGFMSNSGDNTAFTNNLSHYAEIIGDNIIQYLETQS